MCTFGVLGLSCEAPAARETQKERNGGGRGKKKKAKFWAAEGGPAEECGVLGRWCGGLKEWGLEGVGA